MIRKLGLGKKFQSDVQAYSSSGSDEYQELDQLEFEGFTSSVSQALGNINTVCFKSARALSGLAMNIAYNAKHSSCPWIQRKPILLSESEEPAFLLGKRYPKNREAEFLEAFQSIIWISYRAQSEQKISDAGWGCMIRVCQMVLAETLKRCSKNKHSSEIFKEFSSSQDALFSFDKICEEGNIFQRWTSSTQILAILTDLVKRQTKFKLKLEVFSIGINIDDIGQKENYPIMISVTNRLGEKSVDKKYEDHLINVLEDPRCVGMIGGIGGQAIYITGHQERNLIILDPHYIQSDTEGVNIHYKKTPRGVPIEKIVPSVTFCFYLRTKNEHIEWFDDMAEMCYFHWPNTAIQMEKQVCEKVYEERHPKKIIESDQEFEILE